MRRAGLVLGLVMVACCALAQSALGFVQVPGSPFPGGRGPFSLAFSPGGRLLAVANHGRYRGLAFSLSMFSVNQRTGALTQVASSPFRAGPGPDSVVFSPRGELLAVANVSGHSVSVFAVDQRTGALTQVPGSPFPTAGEPVAFSPGGRLLATANPPSDGASVFSVNQRTGALTQVPGSPFSTGLGSYPQSVAFSPAGGLLAVTNNVELLATGYDVASVSMFSVDQRTGALTQVPGSPFPTGPGPDAATFNPAGTLLAVTNYYDQSVSVFSVGPTTGALTQVRGSPFPIATGPGAESLAFSPGGGLLAVANDGSSHRGFAYSLSMFSVNQRTGALTQLPGSPFRAGLGVESVAFSPAGGLLAATSDGHNVSVFSTAVLPSNRFTISHVHTSADGTITFAVDVPGPGSVKVLEAAHGFVFARAHTAAHRASTIRLSVRPNARGRDLLADHARRVTLRLQVTYTPSRGRSRSAGIHGLHLP